MLKSCSRSLLSCERGEQGKKTFEFMHPIQHSFDYWSVDDVLEGMAVNWHSLVINLIKFPFSSICLLNNRVEFYSWDWNERNDYAIFG